VFVRLRNLPHFSHKFVRTDGNSCSQLGILACVSLEDAARVFFDHFFFSFSQTPSKNESLTTKGPSLLPGRQRLHRNEQGKLQDSILGNASSAPTTSDYS
jgi:hypothetical protein